MTSKTRATAAEAVKKQHATILQAIAIMQSELDTMTSSIDPETTSWRDVAKFAQVSEVAAKIIARHEETGV